MSIYGPSTWSACCSVPMDQITCTWFPTGWMVRARLTTATVKLHVAVLPQASLAVTVPVVVPTGNVLPRGGLATMVGGVQPPLAVMLKNTTAPAGPVAATV